jgi:hypothetical protein
MASLPPFPDQTQPDMLRATKTDTNFFKRNADDDLFGTRNQLTQSVRAPYQPISRSRIDTTANTNEAKTPGQRLLAQQNRQGHHDDDDFFSDPDKKRREEEDKRKRASQLEPVYSLGPMDSNYAPDSAGLYQDKASLHRIRELELDLHNTKQHADELRRLKDRIAEENSSLKVEVERYKTKNEDLTSNLARLKNMHDETLKDKQRHFDEVRQTIDHSSKEMRDRMQQQHEDTVRLLKDTYENELASMRKMLEKDPRGDITNINNRIKQVQEDFRSQNASIDLVAIKDKMNLIGDQLKDLKDRRDQLEKEKAEIARKFADENRLIMLKYREFDELKARLDQRELEVTTKENSLLSVITEREKRARDKEIDLEGRENRINHASNLLKREKLELEEIVRSHSDKMDRDKRQLEQRLMAIQDKEFESEKKLKHAIERESDTRLKQEEVESKLRTLKLREEALVREKDLINEQTKRVQKDKSEIQLFKDNIEIEKNKNMEEHRRLNVFASKLNSELETLNKDKTNVDMMKKTLASLRMDYTGELMTKMNRDQLVSNDVFIYPHPSGGREHIMDLVRRPVPVTNTLDIAEHSLTELPTKRFNYDDYMTRLKYNY